MTSSVGLQRFIISSYPSTEINFVEIHLCMLQRWLLKQSWKQTPCGGKEGGEQGEKKKRKERKLWPQLTEIKLCSVTLKKKRGWSLPHQKSRNRTDTITKLLSVLFSLSLPQRREKMPLLRAWTGEKFLFTKESPKATTDLNVYWNVSVIFMSNFSTLFSQ